MAPNRVGLTPEQRAIVEAGDGPVVVIAGAGTGKTRVIVERVRWLLETREDLLPEQLLVLTYNVKAAAELATRLDEAVGVATRSRMSVSNFHSFCQRVLTESAADAGLPARPDVLDGVGQMLLLQDLRGELRLRYHSNWAFPGFVQFINRAKDELVAPEDFDRFVEAEQDVFEARYGSFAEAEVRLETQGNLGPLRKVRAGYADLRARERAGDDLEGAWLENVADREARRTIAGDGQAHWPSWFPPEDLPRIDKLADDYVRDAAALEVVRLRELARVYHAYEAELARRGALDFGEQIALVARLFRTKPNVLRRWQRQFRYILVDEFQDANVAQIELIELLGRTPDRPDNVMVVGDDDQSIYRFRGASFAAFAEFDERFSRPPAHDRIGRAPGTPRRLRIEQNFRSVGHVLTGANRLIGGNETRYEPDKRLWTEREAGLPIELHVCASPEDEAVAIVDAIQALVGGSGVAQNGDVQVVPTKRNDRGPSAGSEQVPLAWNDLDIGELGEAGLGEAARPTAKPRWGDVAILYRKHRHRDAIVKRLRDEDIPYTVVGGLSLFEAPEIRDLEQGLRAIANPEDDVALVRMMTAGPWRLDALEILRVTTKAKFDETRLLRAATAMRDDEAVAPELRAKLRLLVGLVEELNPQTWREGPWTILERYVERTGQVLDLLAAGTLEAKRSVANIASFMRFAADWQAANPGRSLADFVGYLDAYKAAGGELPTSVELSEDVDGVRLMTLYQAKGLEFPIVIVPELVEDQWPVRDQAGGWFPRELLREAVPTGDIHIDEERRLLYVAMTRAQERLILTTLGIGDKAPSRFIGELLNGAGEELTRIDRTGDTIDPELAAIFGVGDEDDEVDGDGVAAAMAAARRVLPLPTARERRLELRLRASELVGLMEATADADPEGAGAREAFAARLADVGRNAAMTAEQARAAGLDPLTFRSLADAAVGANLLQVAPLPATFSYSSLSTYEACPLRYAFRYVYRIPEPDRPVAPFAFGTTAHEAFEAFTRERRERLARGEAAPTREDLDRLFRERWVPQGFGDKVTEEGYARRIDKLLENFWDGEVSSVGEAIGEEVQFDLAIDPGDGTPPVRIYGEIDRIDRLPSGGIEVIDYKTGKVSSQKDIADNLQLTIYALACRDALGLGTPERVTLYFTESAIRMSTMRTDEELDAAREAILARVSPIRAGEFVANPGRACQWCDYRAMCPERA